MNLDAQVWQYLVRIGAVILLVAALVGLAWFALRHFIRRWKSQFMGRVGDLQVQLKKIKDELDRIGQAGRLYGATDPEPYGRLAGELHQFLERLRQDHADRSQQLSHLCLDTLAYPEHRLERFGFGFWAEPRYWWRRYRAAEGLWRSLEEPRGRVGTAGQLLDRLQAIPVEVARRSRELYHLNDQIGGIVQGLYVAGLQGGLIDSARDEAQQLETRLKSLPVYFFQEADDQVQVTADKQATILAWQTLAEIEAPIRTYLSQFQRWQTSHQETGRQLQTMRETIDLAQARLAQLPPAIDGGGLAAELEQADTEAEELEARYGTPTIEILTDLSARLAGLTEVAQWVIDQVTSIQEKYGRLTTLLHTEADLVAQTAAAMAGATQADRYPLAWQGHQVELERLMKLETSIGTVELRRTPADLDAHLNLAIQLSTQVETLRTAVTTLLEQRERLTGLLERPDMLPEPAWWLQAKELQSRVARYAPKNWPDEDNVTKFWTQAGQLAGRRQDLVPPQAGQPLPAETLGQYLNSVQALVTDLETFQARLRRIEARLAALQQMEGVARQKITTTLQTMEPLFRRLQGIAYPPGPTLAGQRQQLEKWRQEGHKLTTALDKPKDGQVTDKDRRVNDWVKSGSTTVESLHRELLQDIKTAQAQLSREIKALQQVALFDRERAVRAAGQLLQAQGDLISLPAGEPDQTPLALLIGQIDTALGRREELHQATVALATQVKDRLSPQIYRLNGVRQEAEDAVDDLDRRVNARDWPPVTVDLKGLRETLAQAANSQERLKSTGHTVAEVLSEVGSLIKSYEAVVDRAREQVTAVQEQQNRVKTLLNRIEQGKKSLESYRARSSDSAAIKAVDERLDRIKARLAEAHGPHLSYNQVTLILEELRQLVYQNLQVYRDGRTETIRVDQLE